jgi:transcriptional regulator with XRE-family HTH domain
MSTQRDNVISLRWRPTIKFSTRLRETRLEYGQMIGQHINQERMAELLEVPAGTYKGWESGNSRPADLIELAHTMERKTGVDPAWLLDVADQDPEGPNRPPAMGVPRFTWNEEAAGRARRLREAGPLVHDLDLAAA